MPVTFLTNEDKTELEERINNINQNLPSNYTGLIKNVINMETITTGGYYNGNKWIVDSRYASSDYIPCKAGDCFRPRNRTINYAMNVSLYNSNKEYISKIDYTAHTNPWITISNNSNIAYMKLTIKVSDQNHESQYVYNTSELVSATIEYDKPILKCADFITDNGITLKEVGDKITSNEALCTNQWFGKSWYAYGTSLTATTSGKYATYLEELSGMVLTNKGIGGGGICSNTNIKIAVMNTTDGKTNADIITLEVGANDTSATLGTIYDTGDDTFCGALNQCIRYLQENTSAQIVVISSTVSRYSASDPDNKLPPETTYGTDNHTKYDQIKAIEEVCKINGVYHIPMGEGSGLGYARMNNSYLVDNIHHTELGGYNLAHFLWQKLKNIPLWYTEIPE